MVNDRRMSAIILMKVVGELSAIILMKVVGELSNPKGMTNHSKRPS